MNFNKRTYKRIITNFAPVQIDDKDWKVTIIRKNSSIGNNSTILPVEIGENAVVGAGSTVTKDVLPSAIIAGNPAKLLRIREIYQSNREDTL